MTTLDDHLALKQTAENEWTIRAHPEREANTGMFGGWTAAVLMKAALSHSEAEGTPVAFTANFIARVDPGADVTVRATRLGGGKSLKAWRAEIAMRQATSARQRRSSPRTGATATASSKARRRRRRRPKRSRRPIRRGGSAKRSTCARFTGFRRSTGLTRARSPLCARCRAARWTGFSLRISPTRRRRAFSSSARVRAPRRRSRCRFIFMRRTPSLPRSEPILC